MMEADIGTAIRQRAMVHGMSPTVAGTWMKALVALGFLQAVLAVVTQQGPVAVAEVWQRLLLGLIGATILGAAAFGAVMLEGRALAAERGFTTERMRTEHLEEIDRRTGVVLREAGEPLLSIDDYRTWCLRSSESGIRPLRDLAVSSVPRHLPIWVVSSILALVALEAWLPGFYGWLQIASIPLPPSSMRAVPYLAAAALVVAMVALLAAPIFRERRRNRWAAGGADGAIAMTMVSPAGSLFSADRDGLRLAEEKRVTVRLGRGRIEFFDGNRPPYRQLGAISADVIEVIETRTARIDGSVREAIVLTVAGSDPVYVLPLLGSRLIRPTRDFAEQLVRLVKTPRQ